jgi:hypothetical protein
MKFTRGGAAVLVAIAGLAVFSGSARPPGGIIMERDQTARMRDGVALNADVYRPSDDGKYSVLLVRTPYDKAGQSAFGVKAAQQGYVLIAQDVRGRFSSPGEFYTFKNEGPDGYDTIEWAAALPYSDGRVVMYSGSYVGATQWLPAILHPPHLVAIAPTVTASNYHDGWVYMGGALEQWFDESWTSGLVTDTLKRKSTAAGELKEMIQTLPVENYVPVAPAAANTLAPYFKDWVDHPAYDDYWKQWSIEDHHADVRVPALNIGGWYDIFLRGTLRNYVGMKKNGGTPEARAGQRLLIGPWYHGPFGSKTGDVDFGPSAAMDTQAAVLRWYDFLLKHADNEFATQKPVKIFVMGKNVWREEDAWPLERARPTHFYFHSTGKANSGKGDGGLSTAAPGGGEAHDSFAYDPGNPVPTRGGGLCCPNEVLPSGAFDQRAVEDRSDVLVYSTPALEKDTEVTGPISVDLYIKSSAVDTDFTAKLVDVGPDGYARNLIDGIQRARYRDSAEKAELMKPGEVYRLSLDLAGTSNVFLAGHRIRVEISSSNFPRFNRNLNTEEDPGHGTKWVTATNSVLHDAQHPSSVILPIVP